MVSDLPRSSCLGLKTCHQLSNERRGETMRVGLHRPQVEGITNLYEHPLKTIGVVWCTAVFLQKVNTV